MSASNTSKDDLDSQIASK